MGWSSYWTWSALTILLPPRASVLLVRNKAMRYTIIHHDVRSAFGLTPSEYMVCDSIHQLSHKKPTSVDPKRIAEFLGVHFDTVYAARKRGIEVGALQQTDEGWSTTELWWKRVTFASGEVFGKSENFSENPTVTQYIIKEDIISETKVSQNESLEDDLSIEVVDDNGDPYTPRWGKKDTSYREVFELFGKYPKAWERNKTQITAARALKAEKDWDQVKKAVKFYLDNSHKPFIPNVSTPYDLDQKWEKLLEFKYKV